jgi:hypothetical protein
MHVLYVHPNFPTQLGPIALQLARTPGFRCTAVSEPTGGAVSRVEVIRYQRAGGARPENHFCSRSFENAVWNCDGVYRALAARPGIRPDLVVGHSGFGSICSSANSTRTCRSSTSSNTTTGRTIPRT